MKLKNFMILNKNGVQRGFGEIYEDDKHDFPDGHLTLTSQIVEFKKGFFVTESDSLYEMDNQLDLRAFCEWLMNSRLQSHGRQYCLYILVLISQNHDCPSWFEQYMRDIKDYNLYD